MILYRQQGASDADALKRKVKETNNELSVLRKQLLQTQKEAKEAEKKVAKQEMEMVKLKLTNIWIGGVMTR